MDAKLFTDAREITSINPPGGGVKTDQLMDLDLDPHSDIQCTPPPASASFADQMMAVFTQLSSQASSFVSALDATQIQSLCKICTKRTALDGQVVMKEGEIGDYLAVVLIGRLSVDQFGKRTACMNCGDAIGEMELCQAGASSRRFATVVALEDSVLAQIPYDTFLAYVEGLGSKAARKLSRYMADLVLARVVNHEAEAGREDRRRLETIGRTRRQAISGPPTDMNVSFNRPESDKSLATIPSSEEMLEIKKTLKATFDRIHLLSSMHDDLKNLVMNEFTVVNKKHGEAIAKKGDVLNCFYIIHRGSCGIYVPNILRADNAKNVEQGSNPPGSDTGVPSAVKSVKMNGQATNRSIGTARSGAGGNGGISSRNDAASSADNFSGAVNQDSFRSIPARLGGKQRAASNGENPPLPALSSWMSPKIGGMSSRSTEIWRLPSAPVQVFEHSASDQYQEGHYLDAGDQETAESNPSKSNRHAGGNDTNIIQVLSARHQLENEHSESANASPQVKLTNAKRLVNAAHLIGHAAASFSSVTQRKKKKELQNPFVGMECAKVLTAHNWFSEIALVNESTHENTIICHHEVTLLALDHASLHRVRLRFEQQRFNSARELLERAPFAPALKPEQICNLVDSAALTTYAPGQTIFSEADSGTIDRFYVLATGIAVEARGDAKHRRDVKEYKENDSFCEWSLYNDPDIAIDELRSNPIITAISACSCICVDRHSFNVLLGPYEDIIAEFQMDLRSYSMDKKQMHSYSSRVPLKQGGNRSGHRHGEHGIRHERRKSVADIFEPLYDSLGSENKRSPRKSPRKKMYPDHPYGSEMPPPQRMSHSVERRVAARRLSQPNGGGPMIMEGTVEQGLLPMKHVAENVQPLHQEMTRRFELISEPLENLDAVQEATLAVSNSVSLVSMKVTRSKNIQLSQHDSQAIGDDKNAESESSPQTIEVDSGQDAALTETSESLQVQHDTSIAHSDSDDISGRIQSSSPPVNTVTADRGSRDLIIPSIQTISVAVEANSQSTSEILQGSDSSQKSGADVATEDPLNETNQEKDNDDGFIVYHDATIAEGERLDEQAISEAPAELVPVDATWADRVEKPSSPVASNIESGTNNTNLVKESELLEPIMMHADNIPPRTPGEMPKTPGGTVLVNPLGWSSTPLFKSPAATPSQSRVGSSHGLPLDRRSRSTTSHVMISGDEFNVPSGRAADVYSDDEDAPADGEGRDGRRGGPKLPKVRRLNQGGKGVPPRPKSVFGMVEIDQGRRSVAALGGRRLGRESGEERLYRTGASPSRRDEHSPGALGGPRGARFDKGQARSALEWNLVREAALPGPGAYDLAAGRKLGCLKIGLGYRRSVWQEVEKKAAQSPAPGDYDADNRSLQARARQAAAAQALQARRAQLAKLAAPPAAARAAGGRAAEGSLTSGPRAGLSAFEEAVVSCIEKHCGGQYQDLPEQTELCYELRCVEPIKRAYLDQGIDL